MCQIPIPLYTWIPTTVTKECGARATTHIFMRLSGRNSTIMTLKTLTHQRRVRLCVMVLLSNHLTVPVVTLRVIKKKGVDGVVEQPPLPPNREYYMFGGDGYCSCGYTSFDNKKEGGNEPPLSPAEKGSLEPPSSPAKQGGNESPSSPANFDDGAFSGVNFGGYVSDSEEPQTSGI